MLSEQAHEIEVAAVKVAPPAAVALASVSGWGAQDWMYAATIVYIALQGSYLIWKWVREWRAHRRAERA